MDCYRARQGKWERVRAMANALIVSTAKVVPDPDYGERVRTIDTGRAFGRAEEIVRELDALQYERSEPGRLEIDWRETGSLPPWAKTK